MGAGDIVAWDLSLSPNLEQTNRMLDRAFRKYPNLEGLVLHSDMGWQYQHPDYQRRLRERGIVQSMSRKGNCIDNCIMESFFGTLKNEMFYGHESEFKTFEDLYEAIEKYINYYNNERIKSKTKWMPPSKFREASMLSLWYNPANLSSLLGTYQNWNEGFLFIFLLISVITTAALIFHIYL